MTTIEEEQKKIAADLAAEEAEIRVAYVSKQYAEILSLESFDDFKKWSAQQLLDKFGMTTADIKDPNNGKK